MWFAHAVGPLGTYVRTRWMYIEDIQKCLEEGDLSYGRVSLSRNELDDIIKLSSLDPDMVDVLKNSKEDGVCVYIYGV
ncbi:MAG: hypothetical protein RMI56_06235 [Sulfolobales archaeon]|nr:hypothetical protein [Sulfolobales archaeon]MDW8083375.1 hypothetical protein [Sulfolobales archaeon]